MSWAASTTPWRGCCCCPSGCSPFRWRRLGARRRIAPDRSLHRRRAMFCALTVRKLKPGTFEDFKRAFIPDDDVDAPAGWKRFYALQNVNDENEVITFGLFDGTLEELRAGQQDG